MKQLTFSTLLFASLLLVSCKSKGAEESTATTGGESNPSGVAYKIDIPRTELKWNAFKPTGTHFGIIPVTGGTIYVDNGLITGGNVDFDLTKLEVKDLEGEYKEKLETHLKGTVAGKEDDFFNVGKFPTANYKITSSTKLENDPLGTHMINGELTMKGITKPVSFKAVVDMASGTALKAVAEPFVIDRTNWDIKFQSKKFFSDLQDDFINDEVKLELTVGAVKLGQ
jgi:YceI-like protein